MFWTLDLNGHRYIVKAFNGGAQGGMRYRYWAGPEKGFAQKPLAISSINTSQSGAASFTEDQSQSYRSQFVLPNRKRTISTHDSESPVSSSTTDSSYNQRSVKRRKTEVDREFEQLEGGTPPAQRRSDIQAPLDDHQSGSLQPTKSASNEEERRKQEIIKRIEKAVDRTFDQIFTPWADKDQRVGRKTLKAIENVIDIVVDDWSPQHISRELNKELNGGDGKRQPAGGNKPIKACFDKLATKVATKLRREKQLEREKPERTNVSSVNGSPPRELWSPLDDDNHVLDPRGTQHVEAEGPTSSRPDPQSVPPEGDRRQLDEDVGSDSVPLMSLSRRKQDSDILPLISLSRGKQTRTTLMVRVAPSSEYMPLKLNECMTTDDFYTKVLGVWEIGRERVAKMTVTFTWMDPSDKMRTMAMNSHVEGCLAHLLEEVDEAPTWAKAPEGKGKCVLDVDIVLKE